MKAVKRILLASTGLLLAVGAWGQGTFKPTPKWLDKAAFYQIYPQSFKDSDGDGIGDINGIIQKLDYIKWLGCNAIWINPCFESAFQDAGYDVIDFYKVASRYGTNEDMRRLFKEAHRRNMKVCLDLVAGHTSIESPWFKMSQQRERNEYSDRYIWTPDSTIKPDKFVTGVFERNGTYMKNFFDCQPALNYGYGQPDSANVWEQPTSAEGPQKTRKELMKIMDYWMDLGCDGFRVDLASSLVKKDPNLTETYKLWAEVRNHFQSKHPKGVLIAEWGNPKRAIKAGFMVDFIIQFGGSGYNELFFNKEGVFRKDTCYFDLAGNGSPMKYIANIRAQLDSVANNGYVCIPTSNHDFQRPHSGARNTTEQLKCVMAFLFTQPGVPLVYYGDEIGMRYISNLPNKEGSVVKRGNRAGSRTPMQWDLSSNAGFSTALPENIYLPVDAAATQINVQSQMANTKSLLHFTKQLLALRAKSKALSHRGEIKFYNTEAKSYPLVYTRQMNGERYLIVINPSGAKQRMEVELPLVASVVKEPVSEGVAVAVANSRLTIDSEPTSYGVFKLK